jgi:hypothetical protein
LVKVVDIQDNFFEVIRGEVAMAMGKEIAMSGNGVREDFTNNGIEIGRHAGRVARRREGRKGQGKSPGERNTTWRLLGHMGRRDKTHG